MIEQLNHKGTAFECVNVGDQIMFEMSKRLDAGKRAAESFKTHSYVEDEIVCEIMQNIRRPLVVPFPHQIYPN